MNELWTIDDIATTFKTSRRTVAEKWVMRPDFPPPRFAPTRRSRLWDAQEIQKWATPKSSRPSERQC